MMNHPLTALKITTACLRGHPVKKQVPPKPAMVTIWAKCPLKAKVRKNLKETVKNEK